MIKKFIFTLVLASFSIFSYAVIRYVKPIATGTGDGSSWTNASGNLQAMINAAIPTQDEIWVAGGTYYPTAYPSGCSTCGTADAANRNNTFLLKSGLRIYGGFAGTETARANRNSHLNETVLSGDLGVQNEAFDNAYHVVTAIDCNSNTTLERFTIEGGNANGSTSVTVAGRTYYRSWGGGVLCVYSPIRIALCAIVENRANDGGGILNTACNPYITNCVIALNIAFAGGGGIYNHEGSAADIRRCTITQNRANAVGGALYNYNSNIYLADDIIWDNSAPSIGGIANNGSTVTGVASLLQDGFSSSWCTNCLGLNPQFMNAELPAGIDGKWGSRDDGLRISSCSYVIDKGTGGATEGVDMSNQTRTIDIPSIANVFPSADGTDIGAYEYQNTGPSNLIFYVNGNLLTGLNDGSSWANAFRGANAFGTALLYANNCDNNTILVAKGIYKPHSLPFGVTSGTGRDYTFGLKGGLKIYGGFDGTGSPSEYSSRKARQNETILSGDFANNDFIIGTGATLSIINNGENAYHVLSCYENQSLTKLAGFTIQGGNAVGASNSSGGGILGDYASPLEINDCIIKYNAAANGGGVYINRASTVFYSNFFDRNAATADGGGVYATESGLDFINNVFAGNRASGGIGGAIRNDLYFTELYNNTFYNNSAQTSGGALFTYDPGIAGAPIDINKTHNCIFYKNAVGSNTSAVYADFFIERNGREFKNNILQLASSNYPLNNTSNGIGATAAENLFAVNPLFRNETNILGPDLMAATDDDGLALQRTGPGVNTGRHTAISSFDILGNIHYLPYDIGAYELLPKEACAGYKYIADVPVEPGTHYAGTLSATGNITAVGTIATGAPVVFDAGSSVTLLPGFQTQTGAVFYTNLQGCTGIETSVPPGLQHK